jgi:small-conductance mechanosensitive channel
MFRHWLWLLPIVPLALLGGEAANSQQPPRPAATQNVTVPPDATSRGATAPATDASGMLSPEQARDALDTLNDPRKRAALAATLEALARRQPEPRSQVSPDAVPPSAPADQTADAPKSAPPGIAIQLAPDSLGAQVLLTASSLLSDTADEASRAFKAIQSIPLLWGWAVVMVTNPLGRQLLADTGWRLGVTVALALCVWMALRLALRRPMARVVLAGRRTVPPEEEEDALSRAELGATEPPARHRHRPGLGRRIGPGLARFALQMVPVLGLLVAGHVAAASTLGGPRDSRLVILAVLDAIVASQTLLALLTLLFMPDPPGLKLLPLRPSAGAYLVRWGRALILIAVPGYTIGVVALLLGLSPTAHDALQKAVGLVLVVCLTVIVVQRRRSVRRWLSAPSGATGVLAWSRNGLARYWHWIALFFLTSTWVAWTVSTPDAVARILWYFVTTVTVLFVAAIVRTAILAMLGFIQAKGATQGAGSEDASATPARALRERLIVYNPAIGRLATLVVNVLALLALLQLYGLGGLSWLLTSVVGQRIVSGVLTLTVTIALAVAVWEVANIAIQSRLESLRRGGQAARSARMRTLLPLIRTTLAITVIVVAGLMVLSEIGVNIAPLLAGAGIVGVAIGFGSQKLVQDVITGVFLLLENTMQVGDVVKVGDQSGVVESLSVRTIRLRTEDGSVVVMPFSAVTTVVNMTRDYSRAVIAVNVAQGEDVDRVVEAMREIVRQMREEDAWNSLILDDLEVMGLERFTDTALQIKCRIMCTPFGRWSVSREFNRRLQMRFQVVAIAAPFSALRLMAPEPQPGHVAAPESATAAAIP